MKQALSIFGTGADEKAKDGKGRPALAFLLASLLTIIPLSSARAQTGNLLLLAEILGAVHHLRAICQTNEGQLWRNKMVEMMGVGNPSESEKQQMIRRFNDGFYRYRNAYPACTDTAAAQANKLMQDGRHLSEMLAATGYGR